MNAAQMESYRQRLNLEGAIFSRIDHEEGIVAVVYKIVKNDGVCLILKISDRVHDYLREVHFLNYFAGKLPVPKVIKVVPPEKDLPGAILMECLPGHLLKSGEFGGELAFDLGQKLAVIHLERYSGYGDPMKGDLYNDPRIYFSLKFEEGLQECREALSINLIKQCERYYKAHVDLLANVDGPCIVHRDYRPGNIIVDDEEKLQGIIDWAGARASFAEEDFCSMEHGEWAFFPGSKTPFLEGYKSIRPLPRYDQIMPLLRLSKAIATIGYTTKSGISKSRGAKLTRWNLDYLEQLMLLEPIEKNH